MTLGLVTCFTLLVFYVPRCHSRTQISRDSQNMYPYVLGTKDLILLHDLRNTENSLNVKTNRLFSRNSGKFVRITEEKVDGLADEGDKDAVLRMESVGFSGQMRLRSANGSHYLCLTDSGRVKAMSSKEGKNLDRCMFYQLQSRGYAVFMSKINKDWYLGITKRGKTKSAKKTHMMQRATHFLEY